MPARDGQAAVNPPRNEWPRSTMTRLASVTPRASALLLPLIGAALHGPLLRASRDKRAELMLAPLREGTAESARAPHRPANLTRDRQRGHCGRRV